MYNYGITSLFQILKTAKSRIKKSVMSQFQFINDVEFLYICAQVKGNCIQCYLGETHN